jgi:hypothetical protein
MKPKHIGRAPDADGYYRQCCVCLRPTLAVTTRSAICDYRDEEHDEVYKALKIFHITKAARLCMGCMRPLTEPHEVAKRMHDGCHVT